MQVSASLCHIIMNRIRSSYRGIFFPGRIPDNYIKPASLHDSIELDPPVEWLVALLPLSKPGIILFSFGDTVTVNAVLRGQVAVQFHTQYSQHLLEVPLVGGQNGRILILLRLKFSELLESTLDVPRLLLNALNPVIEDHLALHSLTHCLALNGLFRLFLGGKADQGISGAEVEIDVGQRFDVVEAIDLGDEFEEETQLADFRGLFHNIDAVEVADNDRFVDKISEAWMLLGPLQDSPEVIDIGGAMRSLWGEGHIQCLTLFDQVPHALQAGLVEVFENK